ENGYFVKVIGECFGIEFVELVGLRREKTYCSIGGKARKMKKIHGWKTLKGAEKYIESEKLMDELMELNREYEIVQF
nr:hypothetical protein [Bacillota bacterium]